MRLVGAAGRDEECREAQAERAEGDCENAWGSAKCGWQASLSQDSDARRASQERGTVRGRSDLFRCTGISEFTTIAQNRTTARHRVCYVERWKQCVSGAACMSVRLGEILLKESLITQDQLEKALEFQRSNAGKLPDEDGLYHRR